MKKYYPDENYVGQKIMSICVITEVASIKYPMLRKK
jgi:hypothetical protein